MGSESCWWSSQAILAPSERYEIYLALVRGETTINDAAQRAGVDRSTIVKLRQVTKEGALEALAASRPGVRAGGVDPEPVEARAEIARLSEALKELAVRLTLAEGKGAGDDRSHPRRCTAVEKRTLLGLIDHAVAGSWSHRAACAYLELFEGRAWRWRRRRDAGCLDDLPAGGNPVHGRLAGEVDEIVGLFEEFGEIDRSHRKLAHRGSYTGRVWVSPASVLRVLAARGLVLPSPTARATRPAAAVPSGRRDHGSRHAQVDHDAGRWRGDQHPDPGRVPRSARD